MAENKTKKIFKKPSSTSSKTKKLIIIEDSESNINNKIKDFKQQGISVLQNLNEEQLISILREANKAYYNEQPVMSDNEYDIVKEFLEKKYPTNQEIHLVGAPVERNKVTLPYFMGSMDKIKPDTSALMNWMKKFAGPYILSCKLDGVSALYTTEGAEPKLYTRGDGKVGQDVSHLIPYLRLPPKKGDGLAIRGEFIIPKKVFESKYKTTFANPRNMVAGIVNHKTISDAIHDVHFVAYEIIQPVLNPSEQMELLETIGVERVLYRTIHKGYLTNELLSELLVNWRTNYAYEIDGIIVTNDNIYKRKEGNPEHAFAFKMVLSDQVAEVKVVDVIWAPSKDGYLKPRVQIEPIQLGGVQIEYTTGFNGSFIEDNIIGIGAVIEIIRSGDVIPYIRKVVVPAEQAKMPLVPYKWNDTHVDVMLENIESDETVREKNITGFFRGIGVEGLSSGNITRIIQAGFDSVSKILKMKVSDFLQVEGFKIKTATKLYEGIREKIEEASLLTIMSASNMFGRGFSEKKIELILESYPGVLLSLETDMQKIQKIISIKGMAIKSAEMFVERINSFIEFMKEIGLTNKLNNGVSKSNATIDKSHILFGKTVVLTGTREKNIIELLDKVGGKQGSSVSKSTFLVIAKNKHVNTGKVEDANKLNIPVMSVEEFLSHYKL